MIGISIANMIDPPLHRSMDGFLISNLPQAAQFSPVGKSLALFYAPVIGKYFKTEKWNSLIYRPWVRAPSRMVISSQSPARNSKILLAECNTSNRKGSLVYRTFCCTHSNSALISPR